MKVQVFPSPRAWKRHTGRAYQVGLSSGALACLGTEPKARSDPASFTGYVGTVRVLTRDDAMIAGQLAAAAIGAGRGVIARRDPQGSMYTLCVPISRTAAQELAHPARVPNIPSPGHGARTAAYDAIMRPTARARIKAQTILQET